MLGGLVDALGHRAILLERNNDDLLLNARRRGTRVPERMGRVHGDYGPCFNAHPKTPLRPDWSTQWLSKGTCGGGPVWLVEGRGSKCYSRLCGSQSKPESNEVSIDLVQGRLLRIDMLDAALGCFWCWGSLMYVCRQRVNGGVDVGTSRYARRTIVLLKQRLMQHGRLVPRAAVLNSEARRVARNCHRHPSG